MADEDQPHEVISRSLAILPTSRIEDYGAEAPGRISSEFRIRCGFSGTRATPFACPSSNAKQPLGYSRRAALSAKKQHRSRRTMCRSDRRPGTVFQSASGKIFMTAPLTLSGLM
jgi:hypothetical protein